MRALSARAIGQEEEGGTVIETVMTVAEIMADDITRATESASGIGLDRAMVATSPDIQVAIVEADMWKIGIGPNYIDNKLSCDVNVRRPAGAA
jgi:hypothetical protein